MTEPIEGGLALYSLIGLVLTFATVVGGVVWRVTRIEKGIRDEMEAKFDNVDHDLTKMRIDIVSTSETARREAGEVGNALRAKVHEVEVYMRDTFVNKDSFEAAIRRVEGSLEKLGDRLEAKVDRAVERLRGGKD